jgi:uncharacterized protein YndB with AHSA1/START domain
VNGQATGSFLELRRFLSGRRARVFQALIEPAALALWWGPAGFATAEIAVDLKVGGAYRLGMQPPEGDLFHLAGRFVEVAPPHRRAYTFSWEEPDPDDQETLVELSLHEVGDGTELDLRQGLFATEGRYELHRQGWTESLDKLCELIDSGAWIDAAERPDS